MARRFGGPNSPGRPGARAAGTGGTGGAGGTGGGRRRGPLDGRSPARAGARVNFLFLAALPLAVRAFFAEPSGLVLNLGAFGLLILAAWLTREGVAAHAAYDARRIARRPAIPRKIFAALLTGAGLMLAALDDGGLLSAAALGTLGAVLHLLAFGPDPLSDKGMEGVDTFQSDRVARAVEGAERHLDAMREAIARTRDRQLEARVDAFAATAREMFRTIEDDPRDLTASRKYLSVYLMGARDAAVKFADIHARTRDPAARAGFEALLDDLEENFAAQTERLLNDDRTDLDIQVEVLRERLAREGVRLDRLDEKRTEHGS